jgi:GH15 family glucan-1,4-alpha-glucosidase
LNHEDAITAVTYWFQQKGYHVEIDRDGEDAIDRDSKFVSINSTRSLETQLHVILHEAGHLLVEKSDKITNGIPEVLSKYSEKSKIHRTFTVIEEIEAWKRGLKLANRLGIKINKEKWNKDVARAIYKYMVWATED